MREALVFMLLLLSVTLPLSAVAVSAIGNVRQTLILSSLDKLVPMGYYGNYVKGTHHQASIIKSREDAIMGATRRRPLCDAMQCNAIFSFWVSSKRFSTKNWTLSADSSLCPMQFAFGRSRSELGPSNVFTAEWALG